MSSTPILPEPRCAGTPAPSTRIHADCPSFEGVVREHHAALLGFATRLTGSRADARDLVQDTLERALRRFDGFADGTNARAWLFTILHNAFIDQYRRRGSDRRAESLDDVQIAAPEPTEEPAWAGVSDEEVAGAVAQLGDEFRAVYRLHAVESLSYGEIAERLAIPMSTVGSRLNRARKKLRTLLGTPRGLAA